MVLVITELALVMRLTVEPIVLAASLVIAETAAL